MAKEQDVGEYLEKLVHQRKADILALRSALLGSNEGITERIRWNAPSFCYRGEDRVTFRLRPDDRLQLVFHRGAKVKDSQSFAFEDDTGLLEWAAPDRAVLTLEAPGDVA